MPISWHIEDDNLLAINITGQLGLTELREAQAEVLPWVMSQENLRALVLLENFSGWEPSEDWGDLSFFEKTDPHVGKIAFVGDEKWRELVPLFALKDLRAASIEYFPAEAEVLAREWLKP